MSVKILPTQHQLHVDTAQSPCRDAVAQLFLQPFQDTTPHYPEIRVVDT